MKLLRDILDMLKTPFVGDLDIPHLFLLVGLVMIMIAAWVMVIRHVQLAAIEIVE